MSPKNSALGFSLLELIVTCSIIAILSLMGVSVYTTYQTRGKIPSLVGAGTNAQLAIANDYFNQGYTFANSTYAANAQTFTTPKSSVVSSISVTTGVITVTGNSAQLGGNSIVLKFEPTVTNNQITWNCCCTNSTYYSYLPTNCRNAC